MRVRLVPTDDRFFDLFIDSARNAVWAWALTIPGAAIVAAIASLLIRAVA